jgi:hypothetical protein
MPRTMWLQFDNCGENKNKEMFAYLSLLIENHIFDEIEVGFLIVGHTHSSIDQYFSVISKAIKSKKTRFIGSPLAMKEIVRRVHKNSYPGQLNPIVRDVHVYYDYKAWLQKYINTDIKYYGIPHCFRLKLVYGTKCAMQYKMFSDYKTFLPLPLDMNTDNNGNVNILDYLVDGIQVDDDKHYGCIKAVGGEQIIRKLSGGEIENVELVNSTKLKTLLNTNIVLPYLTKACKDAINSMELRLEDESNGRECSKECLDEYRELVSREIIKNSNKERGYILFLLPKAGIEPLDPYSSFPLPILSVEKQHEILGDYTTQAPVSIEEMLEVADGGNSDDIFNSIIDDNEDYCDIMEDAGVQNYATHKDIVKHRSDLNRGKTNEDENDAEADFNDESFEDEESINTVAQKETIKETDRKKASAVIDITNNTKKRKAANEAEVKRKQKKAIFQSKKNFTKLH